MSKVSTHLLRLERSALAVIQAMPELKNAELTLDGVERLNVMKAIGAKFNLHGVG